MSRNLNSYKDDLCNTVCKDINRPNVLDSVRPYAYEKQYKRDEKKSIFGYFNVSRLVITGVMAVVCLAIVMFIIIPTTGNKQQGEFNGPEFNVGLEDEIKPSDPNNKEDMAEGDISGENPDNAGALESLSKEEVIIFLQNSLKDEEFMTNNANSVEAFESYVFQKFSDILSKEEIKEIYEKANNNE